MSNKIKGNIKLGAVAISMTCIMVALGFGCGIGFDGLNKDALNGSGSSASVGEVLDNGNLTIVSGQKTVSTLYYEQVLTNMLSVSGVANPSNDILSSFYEKLGAFPEYGSADKINAPMMAGLVAVGSEVCGDLMQSEFDVAQDQRRIFASVDFNSNSVGNAAIADMIRRMARSFWGQNETAEESALIQTAISEMQDIANDNNNTRNFRGDQYRNGALRAALATCSVMISSTAAIEI